MVIRKEIWDKIGGFDQTYYMYYEDTDVSLAVRSLGYKLGLLPKAIVEHDYDYKKSTLKWFYIERNRYLLILQHWPVLLLVLYFPYFLIIELGLWAVSILQRRFVLKLKSTVSMLSTLPTAARMRHRAQKRRVISDYEFLSSLDPEITTPLLGYMASTSLVNAPSVVYFKIVKFIVGLYSEH
jgi:GT2 family glycosyltransferase